MEARDRSEVAARGPLDETILAATRAAEFYPWMKLAGRRIAGRWTDNAGFTAEQRVRISVEHGRLTITTRKADIEELRLRLLNITFSLTQ